MAHAIAILRWQLLVLMAVLFPLMAWADDLDDDEEDDYEVCRSVMSHKNTF